MNNLMEGIDKAISGMNKMSHQPVNETTVHYTGERDAGILLLSGLKRAGVRDKGATYFADVIKKDSTIKPTTQTVIGWMSNKYNPAHGWVICKLDDYDRKWLGTHAKHAFRAFTDKGTSIITIDPVKGTYAFLDNEHYENTDKVKFERKAPYKKFVVDKPEFMSHFGIKVI